MDYKYIFIILSVIFGLVVAIKTIKDLFIKKDRSWQNFIGIGLYAFGFIISLIGVFVV